MSPMPCDGCLVYPACKYKVIFKDMIYFLDLLKCEIFREWYGNKFSLVKNLEIRRFFKVKNIIRLVHSGR